MMWEDVSSPLVVGGAHRRHMQAHICPTMCDARMSVYVKKIVATAFVKKLRVMLKKINKYTLYMEIK